jgi:hypothetical protein
MEPLSGDPRGRPIWPKTQYWSHFFPIGRPQGSPYGEKH